MTAATFSLPALSSDAGLTAYLQEIKKFPMLAPEEEQMLAKRWTEEGDIDSAHTLVTSHLRLVAKIAMGFRGYGLPLLELISEGNIGLMQAVKRFDPEKGFRLSTYAVWWIKASIQEYILRSWSLVKIGTTAAQKKLFFNLKKLRNRIGAAGDRSLAPRDIATIADELDVTEAEVVEMERRLSGSDVSLNEPISMYEDKAEQIDLIADQRASQEILLEHSQEQRKRNSLLHHAMQQLNARERDILQKRRLQEKPETLESLSMLHKVSSERIRQIEVRAIEKLRHHMLSAA